VACGLLAGRLVTLTGPGGVGKSRLTVKVAGRLAPSFAGDERIQHGLAIAEAYACLGQIRLLAGDPDGAARLFTDGLSAARQVPDRFTMLITLYDLGLSSQAQGDLAGAADHLNEGLALAAEAGDLSSVAYYLEELAAVARQQDIPDRAVRLLAAARSLLQAAGSGWLCAWVPRAPHDDDVLTALRSRVGSARRRRAIVRGTSRGSLPACLGRNRHGRRGCGSPDPSGSCPLRLGNRRPV
jgi:tetratricopeptide (TPR) repeat protein